MVGSHSIPATNPSPEVPMVTADVIALFPRRSLLDGELRSFFQRTQPPKLSIPFSGFAPSGVCNHVHHEEHSDGWEVIRCTNPAVKLKNGLLCLSHQGDARPPKRITYRNPSVKTEIVEADRIATSKAKVVNLGTRKCPFYVES